MKSSPDYYGNHNEDVDRCKWRSPASIVPRRSFSAGSAAQQRHYDECDCYHCRIPAAPSLLASSEMGYASKHCRRNSDREIGLPHQHSSFPEQRVRRSASFQIGRSNYGSSPVNGIDCGRDTLYWRDRARTRQPLCSTFNDMDEFDELHIGNTAILPANVNTVVSCAYDDDDDDDNDGGYDGGYDNDSDEIFYADKNVDEILACTRIPQVDANGSEVNATGNGAVDDDTIEAAAAPPQPAYIKSNRNRFIDDERYPANRTEISEIFNPPDIANVHYIESCVDDLDEGRLGDADFMRTQPDILQSAYRGKRRTSSVVSDDAELEEYVRASYRPAYITFDMLTEEIADAERSLKKKSCSLPKSFQRQDELKADPRLTNNVTLLDLWKKYGLRALFLNRKNSEPVSSIMSETAPTTPIKEMPEKKRYGRLMRIGQYSSSPALDDGSMKHINLDCDTKFKKDKYKSNNPATLHTTDFRPASQENIVAGDGVFHKFCKSFSLRFLRKPADHETDGTQKQHDSSPCSNGKSTCESETSQSSRLGPQAWRSSSERNRKINIPNQHKHKIREAQINTDSRAEDKGTNSKNEVQQRLVRRTLSDLNQYCTSATKDEKVDAIVPTRSKAPVPVIARKFKPCSLRRSASQPLLNHKTSPSIQNKTPACRTACSEDERNLFSEDDMMSDSGGSSLTSRKNSLEQGINEDVVIFAEAVWDHVAIESEELPFNAGDVIEVYNVLDREWWWGMCNGKSGWFPSDFVRLRVNQEESFQQRLCESPTKQNASITSLSNEQVRSKIICELLNTERDFVKILKDVKTAFVLSCIDAKEDLFTDEDIYKIFGNWDQITLFQITFLESLEINFNEQNPHETRVGRIFLEFREHFCIYSDYCNNHPLSIATLQQLYQKEKYKTFFENCRVKHNLIALPLDGFLLTPIQRICKYPLQLAELLKHTETEHDDHKAVEDALNAMREVAILINERKRRMESLEKLILWQQRVEGWDGNNLIENSSQLIYQNDVTKVFAGMWTTNVTLFLFDHQLVFCKKDILKRDFYVYKGRISLDGCEIIDVPDGKDTLLSINVRNGLRIQNIEKNKWLLFCCRTQREKAEWLNAFHKEKELVLTDERNKLQITSTDRQLAYITATMCNNRHAFLKHKNKKLKRPINHSRQFRNPTSPHILGRKVGTWFMFGANRKNYRRFISKNHACVS